MTVESLINTLIETFILHEDGVKRRRWIQTEFSNVDTSASTSVSTDSGGTIIKDALDALDLEEGAARTQLKEIIRDVYHIKLLRFAIDVFNENYGHRKPDPFSELHSRD